MFNRRAFKSIKRTSSNQRCNISITQIKFSFNKIRLVSLKRVSFLKIEHCRVIEKSSLAGFSLRLSAMLQYFSDIGRASNEWKFHSPAAFHSPNIALSTCLSFESFFIINYDNIIGIDEYLDMLNKLGAKNIDRQREDGIARKHLYD
jgi:hypothetical protein